MGTDLIRGKGPKDHKFTAYAQYGVTDGNFPRRSPLVEKLAGAGKIPGLSPKHFQVVLQQVLNGTRNGESNRVFHTHSQDNYKEAMKGGVGTRPWHVLQTGSMDVLRSTIANGQRTSNGAWAFKTDYTNRLAGDTVVCWADKTEDAIKFMDDMLKKTYGMSWENFTALLGTTKWVRADRQFGGKHGDLDRTYHASTYVPRDSSQVAAMWALTGNEPSQHIYYPDIMHVRVPFLNTPLIVRFPKLGVGFIFGSNYVGEDKKMGLALATYLTKLDGDIGLHAGGKSITLDFGGVNGNKTCNVVFLGLSGTGKTTLSNLLHLEGRRFVHAKLGISQDDFYTLNPSGKAIGLEPHGFYIISTGLDPLFQSVLYNAAMSPKAMHESVFVDNQGKIDFSNTTLTKNGRTMILTKDVEHMGDTNLDKLTDVVIITRNPLAPALARLTSPEQIAAYFALGETIKTAATTQDPKEIGQATREEGTNPFYLGREGNDNGYVEQTMKFYQIVQQINEGRGDGEKVNVWLVNTGYVGKPPNKEVENQLDWVMAEMNKEYFKLSGTQTSDWTDEVLTPLNSLLEQKRKIEQANGFHKVTIPETDKLILAALSGYTQFEYDPLLQLEVPVECRTMPNSHSFFGRMELKQFSPREYFPLGELEQRLTALKEDRQVYFDKLESQAGGEKFPKEIREAV